jgi:hypothetical protein
VASARTEPHVAEEELVVAEAVRNPTAWLVGTIDKVGGLNAMSCYQRGDFHEMSGQRGFGLGELGRGAK